MMKNSTAYLIQNNFSSSGKMPEYTEGLNISEDWLSKWRKEHKDDLHNLEFDVKPSREYPDYCNNLFE